MGLNKQDLFTEKLATQPLSKYMTDYVGLNEFEPAVDFIKGKFLDRRKDPDKRVYVHATCAMDTSNVRFVFDSVVSIILEDNMKASGLFWGAWCSSEECSVRRRRGVNAHAEGRLTAGLHPMVRLRSTSLAAAPALCLASQLLMLSLVRLYCTYKTECLTSPRSVKKTP